MSEDTDKYDEMIRKIDLLLKKAEGTDNENEARTFFEGAHDLMVRYAIDEQRLRERRQADSGKVEDPIIVDYMYSSYSHHAAAKEALLEAVARHHSVRSITYENKRNSNLRREGNRGLTESQWTRLVGFESDIESVKMLYLSLLIQSQRFAGEDWRTRYGNGKYSDDGTGKFSWISSHMSGFSGRIGTRFRELTEGIYNEVADSKALIVNRDAMVTEFMYAKWPWMRPVSYCWALGAPDPRKPTKEYYCIKMRGHEDPHVFNYKPRAGSSYVRKGRAESSEGRRAGSESANRADIGLTRVGSRQAIKA